jgi:hypothetical protein
MNAAFADTYYYLALLKKEKGRRKKGTQLFSPGQGVP